MAAIATRRQRERLADGDRTREIEHHAGLAGTEQPVPVTGDAPARRRRLRFEAPADFREIDDDAIGIGEREDGEGDLLRQVQHDPGLGGVIAESHRLDGRLGRGRYGGPGGEQRKRTNQQP
jgi:hypothetical protein